MYHWRFVEFAFGNKLLCRSGIVDKEPVVNNFDVQGKEILESRQVPSGDGVRWDIVSTFGDPLFDALLSEVDTI